MKFVNERLQAAPLLLRPIEFAAECLGAFPIAITAALYSVSYAVIVYGSSLSAHLEFGFADLAETLPAVSGTAAVDVSAVCQRCLEVAGLRLNRYRTLYFDTHDFAMYHRHHMGA